RRDWRRRLVRKPAAHRRDIVEHLAEIRAPKRYCMKETIAATGLRKCGEIGDIARIIYDKTRDAALAAVHPVVDRRGLERYRSCEDGRGAVAVPAQGSKTEIGAGGHVRRIAHSHGAGRNPSSLLACGHVAGYVHQIDPV